jgi:hypothetical protein
VNETTDNSVLQFFYLCSVCGVCAKTAPPPSRAIYSFSPSSLQGKEYVKGLHGRGYEIPNNHKWPVEEGRREGKGRVLCCVREEGVGCRRSVKICVAREDGGVGLCLLPAQRVRMHARTTHPPAATPGWGQKTHTHAPVAQKAPGVYQVPRREHAAKELHHAVEQIKGVAEHCVAPKQAHKLHYETHHGDHQGCKDGGAPKGELGGAASTGVPGRYIGGCVVECQYRCYKVTAGQ